MPTTPAERKALLFLGAVAALGVGARVVASVRGDRPATGAMQPALERQLAKAEGEARAARAEREARDARATGAKKKKKGAGKGTRGAVSKKSTRESAADAPTPAIIDVDTADSLALARLPGVGPALARRIVQDRQLRGPFGGLEALDAVPGVGPKLLESLARHVTFSGPRRPILGQGQPDGGRGRTQSRQAGRRRRVER